MVADRPLLQGVEVDRHLIGGGLLVGAGAQLLHLGADLGDEPWLATGQLRDRLNRIDRRGGWRTLGPAGEEPRWHLAATGPARPSQRPTTAPGAARLGPSTDPMAVVDNRCRVHGLVGLHQTGPRTGVEDLDRERRQPGRVVAGYLAVDVAMIQLTRASALEIASAFSLPLFTGG